MKYALMKSKSGQISIAAGEREIEWLSLNNCVKVGTIESDLTPVQLQCGFEHSLRNLVEERLK